MCIHGLFKSFKFKVPSSMCALLAPLIPDIIKVLGTALAIRAGTSSESYCAPTLHCATCPSSHCRSGQPVTAGACAGSWLSSILAWVFGAIEGIGGTWCYIVCTSSSQISVPRKSAARIALEKS